VLGFPVKVEIIATENLSGEEDKDILKPTYAPKEVSVEEPSFQSGDFIDDRYEYTFQNFVVGSKNEFAYTACKSVATSSTVKTYNPLFIYGPSGLGKTHLLMAIKYEVT